MNQFGYVLLFIGIAVATVAIMGLGIWASVHASNGPAKHGRGYRHTWKI